MTLLSLKVVSADFNIHRLHFFALIRYDTIKQTTHWEPCYFVNQLNWDGDAKLSFVNKNIKHSGAISICDYIMKIKLSYM